MLSRRVSLPKCISPSGGASSRKTSTTPIKNDAATAADRSSNHSADDALSMSPGVLEAPAAKENAASSTAIKVVVRVRPLSERELLAKSPVVVNVSKSSVQVVNPALFTDPTFLDAISTASRRYSATNLPVTLTAHALTAANQAGECRSFHFDRCFGVDNAAANESEPFANAYDIDVASQRPNQELVFEEIGREIIPSAFQGFNCTVFAYGQTGSGKTHTMVGEKSTTRGKGVIPRVCEALFQGIDARRAKENELAVEMEAVNTAAADAGTLPPAPTGTVKKTVFAVQMSYCEIYKEKVHDLLDGASPTLTPTSSFSVSASSAPLAELPAPPVSPVGSAANRGKILKVREHPITGPFVEGLSTRLVNSYEEISDEMLAGDKLRTVAATLMNPVSSRSHAMFTLTLTQTTFDAVTNVPTVKTSKIAMIDLAGSERANVSGTSGDRLKEGAMINKSLTTLGRVIAALSKGNSSSERVPYRDSILTWLLKESLGGNAKTTMIAMVSPAAENYDETMSTLRYAESAKKVMNRAVVNEDPNARIIRQLRDEIQQLRDQLLKRETEAFYLVENLKDKTDLPASMQDRDDFYREMQDEMGTYKSQVDALLQKQAEHEEQLKKASRVVRLHAEFPSLLTTKPMSTMGPHDIIVCTLREGTSLVGSEEPPPPATNEDSVNAATQARVEVAAGESQSPRRLIRNTSWAGSFLKRRKSSSAGSALTGDAGESLAEADIENGSSPRKRSLSRRASRDVAEDAATEEPTWFVRLSSPSGETGEGDVLAKHALLLVRARANAALGDVPPAQDEMIEFVVEIQPICTGAAVFVNEKRILPDVRARVLHGDTIQFGSQHRFCLHVPHVAAALQALKDAESATPVVSDTAVPELSNTPSVESLITEANEICEKWHLQIQFASSVGSTDSSEETPTILVKKLLSGKRFSIVQWSREMFEEKIEVVRQLTASFQDSANEVTRITTVMEEEATFGSEAERIDDIDAGKLSVARDADHVNHESERDNSIDDSRSTQTRAVPASMSMDGRYSTTVDTTAAVHITSIQPAVQLPPQALSVRLLGHSRIYFSGLGLEKDPNGVRDVALCVAGYDSSGRQIARLHCQLRNVRSDPVALTSGGDRKDTEVSGGTLLRRGFSFLSPRSAQAATTNRSATHQLNRTVSIRLQVVVEKVEFLRSATTSEHISLTLKKWSVASGSNDCDTSAPGVVESTAKVSAPLPQTSELSVFSFNHTMQFTTPISESGITSGDFVSVEYWGYGEVLPRRLGAFSMSPLQSHKIELFVSVDIEERDADGFFRSVAVKSDGTLRLHINQPRRVSLRITQADHGPFVLGEFCGARLSPAFSTSGAFNLAIGDGKSMQSLLLPPGPKGVSSARSAATTEPDELPTFKEWMRLFPRTAAEMDTSSRSLNVSLRWERGGATQGEATEIDDGENSRSVFRLAVAFKTTLSPVPIVLSKSVVTKMSTNAVTSSQRLAREWENSRTAWWARESFSRSYRLGTWYSVDVVQQAQSSLQEISDPLLDDQLQGAEGEAILEPAVVATQVATHINGLRRLELCFAMERVRQEIVTKYLSTRISDEYPLTLERAQECFEQLLAVPEGVDQSTLHPPVVKVLQLDDGALYLRHKASKEIFVAVETGDVTGVPGGSDGPDEVEPPNPSSHTTHFVSEPTSLVGDASTSSGGEMCGFLMFSTSVQLDESAIAAVVTPSSTPTSPTSSNPITWARNSLTNRLSWERRWFVLKRPFLYAYKSFARKEQIGVLDVVKCQLVVPSGSSAIGRRSSLPGLVSRRGSKPDAPGGGGAFPFCFQLVNLVGTKCIVWSLQASTQAELRAWLVAIDPIKIEARESVVSSNSAQTQPEGAAVITA